jgi:hypothetical protein
MQASRTCETSAKGILRTSSSGCFVLYIAAELLVRKDSRAPAEAKFWPAFFLVHGYNINPRRRAAREI